MKLVVLRNGVRMIAETEFEAEFLNTLYENQPKQIMSSHFGEEIEKNYLSFVYDNEKEAV